MSLMLLDAGAPESCAPLTCTRSLGELPVANRPLREVQMERLIATFGVDAGAAVSHRGDSWLSMEMLLALRTASAPAVVRSADGTALAWVGGGPETPVEDARPLSADAESFLIRYPWDILRINEILVGAIDADAIQGDLSPQATVEGNLVLGEGSRVLPGVFVEGNVMIGRNCKIGPNCYLRGNIAIGDGCHVGQSVEIKNAILMAGSAVGHLSYCGDSIVGENVNFGAGTITANFRHDGRNHRSMVDGELLDTGRRKFGAIFGDGVHTGIHTSIYPGRKLWPHTETRPGTVVQRDLRSSED